ncbi:hypothetical protein N9B74_00680 [bacterium]|nr:hypothetical protein [bacterium]
MRHKSGKQTRNLAFSKYLQISPSLPCTKTRETTAVTGMKEIVPARCPAYLSLSRPASVKNVANTYVNYEYLGLATPVIATSPTPGISLTYVAQGGEPDLYGDPYNGLDWYGRVVDQRWIKSGSDLDRIQYGYTEDSLREWRKNLKANSLGEKEDELYQYDKLSQIKVRQRGVLTSSNVISNVVETENWTYDPSGNWTAYSQDLGGTVQNQERTNTKSNEIDTFNMVSAPSEYDKAGNMTRIPVGVETTSDYREATWDAWNRLKRIRKTNHGGSSSEVTLDVWYDYDGLTRRTQKRIVTGPNQGTVSYYYNSNWKCLEKKYAGHSLKEKVVTCSKEVG